MGTQFRVYEREVTANMASDGLAKTHYYLQDVKSNEFLSPWHDLELIPSTMESAHLTGVIEISKGNTAKLELSLSEPHNPVLSDTNKNKETGALQLRHYGLPCTFNYGFIPQTWESPEENGDCDPIDIVDLSLTDTKPLLAVSDYLILGCLGLIDQGEIDWKVLGLEVTEAKTLDITSIEDFEKLFPGRVSEIREWFRMYKTLDGKPENEFTENGRLYTQKETLAIVL